VAGELQAFLLRADAESLHQILDGVPQRERDPLETEPARLDFREVQDVVDDREQRVGRSRDGVDVLALLGGQPRLEREMRHADDRRHRRADLVAHVREELRLGLGGAFRLRLRRRQLPHQMREMICVLRFGLARQIQLARIGRELLIGGLALGHVPGRGVNDLLVRVRHSGPRQPAIRAVAAPEAVLEMQDDRAFGHFRGFGPRARAIVRVDEVDVRRCAQLGLRETERAHPGRVEALEIAVESRDADQIEGQPEEAIELLFRAAALDELPDLAADRLQHLQQLVIRIADLAAEEFHDAEPGRSKEDGKAERGVQPFSGRDGAAREVAVVRHVCDERGAAGGPDPAGQSDARRKRGLAAERLELGEPAARRGPDRHAAQDVRLRVDLPQRAVLPSEGHADRFEDAWHRLGETCGLGEHSRRRVLGREPAVIRAAVWMSGACEFGHANRGSVS